MQGRYAVKWYSFIKQLKRNLFSWHIKKACGGFEFRKPPWIKECVYFCFRFWFYLFIYFFRIEEVLHITYGNITFNPGYVAINLDRSKTGQLRKGNEVVISESFGNYVCPVKILRRYLTQIERYIVDSGALSKSKSGHKLVSTNKPISYCSIRDYFKSSFKGIDLDVSVFGTHSLRAGGASAAANAGVADRLFHGRWKSVSAMRQEWLRRWQFRVKVVSF